jgi:hypothetical protein
VWEGVNWIRLSHDRGLWRALVNCDESFGSLKGREFLDRVTVSFSRRTLFHGFN